MDKDQSTFDFNQCAILQLCCMTLILYTTVINKHQPVSNYRNTENRKELKVQGKILKIKIIKGGQNLILKHGVFYCLAGCTDVTATCKTVSAKMQEGQNESYTCINCMYCAIR